MRYLAGLISGLILASGIALAQNYFGTDSTGKQTNIYQIDPNTYGWYDSQGKSGIIQQMPSTDLSPRRNPC